MELPFKMDRGASGRRKPTGGRGAGGAVFRVRICATLAILPALGNETTGCLGLANGSGKRGNQCQ